MFVIVGAFSFFIHFTLTGPEKIFCHSGIFLYNVSLYLPPSHRGWGGGDGWPLSTEVFS